jgi:5-methylcytosine-specific restriction endonuclease McrA
MRSRQPTDFSNDMLSAVDTELTTWQRRKVAVIRRCKRARRKLIAELGGKCVECGQTRKLEFHHTLTRTWIARKVSRWVRIARYRREWEQGCIVLLCSQCNKKAGTPCEIPD